MRSVGVLLSYEAKKIWVDLESSDLVKEQVCTFWRTTILPGICFAIFCQWVFICHIYNVSLSENLLWRGGSPFVIRSYLAHLDRKWGDLLKSKRKLCILQHTSFLKEVFWRCPLSYIFLYFIKYNLLYLKRSIFLTPVNVSLLLCCYYVNAVC